MVHCTYSLITLQNISLSDVTRLVDWTIHKIIYDVMKLFAITSRHQQSLLTSYHRRSIEWSLNGPEATRQRSHLDTCSQCIITRPRHSFWWGLNSPSPRYNSDFSWLTIKYKIRRMKATLKITDAQCFWRFHACWCCISPYIIQWFF